MEKRRGDITQIIVDFKLDFFFFNPLFSKFLSNAIIRKLFIGLPAHESRVLTRSPQLRFFLLRFYFLKSLVLKLSLNHFFVIPSIKNVRIYLSFNSVLTALWDIKGIQDTRVLQEQTVQGRKPISEAVTLYYCKVLRNTVIVDVI